MRVALLYRDALGNGGYPRDVRWLATALAASGAEVLLLSRGFREEVGSVEGLGPDVAVLPMGAARELAMDVMHVFGVFIFDHLKWIRVLSDKPLVISGMGHLMAHHLARKAWRKRVALAVSRPVLRRVRWWHAFSQVEEMAIRKIFGETVNVFHAGLGVFPATGGQGSTPEPARREERVRLLFFGRNDVFHKGIDILVRGVAMAVRQGAPVVLTIAGRPWGGSEGFLRRMICELGIEQQVRLVGPVSEPQRDAFFRNHDYLVFLSRWDGPPRPIREAIARGLPVIVSPETNMAEDVLRCGAGLVADLDPAEVARAIGEAAQLGWAWARHRKGAERLREELSWDNVARRYLDGYERVLNWWTMR
jgi:glycosyltransferase involved in cell wall biosynthesis